MKKNRFGQAKVLDTEELDLVIKYLPSKFHQVLANTLRNTGARVGEVIQLTWNDVEEESILFPKEDWTLFKGRKPLPEDYIFYGRFNGSHITSRAFFLALEKSLERAEIRGATSHSFRRSQLTKLHKSGLPLKIIQSLSGHSSLNTLSLYLQVDDEDKKRANLTH